MRIWDGLLTLTTKQIPVQIERWLFEDGIRKIENETLYVPIKKGIDDKEIIILRERGNTMDANLICCVNSKYLHNILFILLLCVFHDTNTSLSLFFFSLFFYCPKKNNIKKKIVILVLVLQTEKKKEGTNRDLRTKCTIVPV